jgi:ankyrin repeat protein
MIFIVLNRFRWVFCQLEALRHCLIPRVRDMLEELPDTLDETYERMLRHINKANRDHAHRVLQCLTVAVRPLRVAELAEVLAIDFGTTTGEGTSKLNTDWRWDNYEAVLSACSSLISIVDDDDSNDSSQVVQFSHFSVKEFLTSSRIADPSAGVSRFHILLKPAHTILAKACLRVVLQLGELVDEHNVDDRFPLVQYAAKHWVQHARFEDVSSHIREGMKLLFDPDKPYFASWLHVHDIDIKPPLDSPLGFFAVSSHEKSDMATPLYYAALCGFHDLAEQLIIEHPRQVKITCGYYVSPLAAALSGGHFMVAQLLHERGAYVDVQGHDNCTALDGASCSGRLEIIRWLLSHSANPHVRDNLFRWTPLHSAACFGHVEVCQLLLQCKVDHNAKDSDGKTPLHLASEAGHVNVARLLLEHGADVNVRDNYRDTPLHHASMEGRLDVALLLVSSGADIDTKDMWGRTAFQVASEGGKLDMARFLSDISPKRLIIPYYR